MKVDGWLSALIELVLPPHCLACGAPGQPGRDLCAGCEGDLPWNRCACQRCALPLPRVEPVCGACLDQPPPWSRAVAPFAYAAPLDRLVQQMKFGGRLAAARLLGGLLLDALREHGEPWPDRLVPVPLHTARLRERGYNQALELARPLAAGLGLPLAHGALRRVRATAAQTGLGARQRQRNLEAAFVAARLTGLRIALIDDVMTTGSTLKACTRALLAAGAREVEVWVLARAPAPRRA